MHCRACDVLLNDFEATRRNANTFDFVDLCNSCYSEVKHIIPAIERKDLMTSDDYDDLNTQNEHYKDFEDIKDFISNDINDN